MKRKHFVPVVLMAGVLALAHNVVYFTRALSPPSPRGVEEDEPDEGDEDDADVASGLETVLRGQVEEYLAALPAPARSPFLAFEEAMGPVVETSVGPPRVEGTLWSRGRRVAWIDGAAYSEGERARGYLITRIGSHDVEVSYGGTLLELPVTAASPPAQEIER